VFAIQLSAYINFGYVLKILRVHMYSGSVMYRAVNVLNVVCVCVRLIGSYSSLGKFFCFGWVWFCFVFWVLFLVWLLFWVVFGVVWGGL